MADDDERTADLEELMDRAEGYLSDAEFREEFEMRHVRYLQATCTLLLVQARQNVLIIELLKKAQM